MFREFNILMMPSCGFYENTHLVLNQETLQGYFNASLILTNITSAVIIVVMLYGNEIKRTIEDVKKVVPKYIFEVSDVNVAIDPEVAGGNCAVVSWLGLVMLEERLKKVPGLFTQFGYSPHLIKPSGKIIVGHAIGRFEVAGNPYFFNQTRDGDVRIGPTADFDIEPSTMFYDADEGYFNFLKSLNDASGLGGEPVINRAEVIERFNTILSGKR